MTGCVANGGHGRQNIVVATHVMAHEGHGQMDAAIARCEVDVPLDQLGDLHVGCPRSSHCSGSGKSFPSPSSGVGTVPGERVHV
jgi:hypothetical protein